MKFKTLIIAAISAIGGIYLTSEEGKKTRESLYKKKSSFEPIIKSLVKDANKILDGSNNIESDAIKANIKLLIKKAKKILLDINLEETMETTQNAIKVASEKIRKAFNEKENYKIKLNNNKNKKNDILK